MLAGCPSILASLPDHLMVLDAQGRIEYINYTVPDLTDPEVIGCHLWEFLPAESASITRQTLEAVRQSREPVQYDVTYRTKDGEHRVFEAHIAPILQNGVLRGFSMRSTDVTEQREAASRGKMSEQELRKLVRATEQSPAAVAVTNHTGAIEYVNPKFEELTGYTQAEIIGQNPRVLNSGTQPGAFYRDLWVTILGGSVWRGDFCNRKKNGELYWAAASISPILDDAGSVTHFVAVQEDVTERRRAAEELEAAYADVRKSRDQLQEMENLRDELVHMIVHDMRSLLMVIQWTLSHLRRLGTSPETAATRSRAMDRIGDAVNELLEMASAQLDVSRSEGGELPVCRESTDVSELAARSIELFALSDDHVSLGLQRAGDATCECDPKLIQRIITNLVSNAVKHVDDDGSIRVTVGGDEHAVCIEVADDGPGIPPEFHERIFQKFGQVHTGTADSAKYSTGIGLTFCRLAAEAHGGTIGVESTPGEGSTFRVVLPRGGTPIGS